MMSICYLLSAAIFFTALRLYKRRGFTDVKKPLARVILFAYVIPGVLVFGQIYSVAGFAVKGALLRDPLVLEDLSAAYGKAKEEREAKESKNALKTLSKSDYEKSPFIGNPDGDVVVLEFYDYTCGFCKRALEATHALIDTDKNVKLVLMNFVIHPQIGTIPARAAIAAAKQGKDKLAKMHDALFAAQLVPEGANESNIDALQTKLVMDLAKKNGLNAEQLKKDMFSSATDEELARVRHIAVKLGLSGTPAFVVGNDKMFPGAVPAYQLIEAVEEVRGKK